MLPLSHSSEPDLFAAAGEEYRASSRALVCLVADAMAVHFQVQRTHVLVPRMGDRVSEAARRVAAARACAVSVLHTGFGWPQSRVGKAFSLTQPAVSEAVSKAADLRDADPALDALLERLEGALRGDG